MNAVEFVRKFGWGKAKEIVNWQSDSKWADHYCISDEAIGSAGRKYSEALCLKNSDFVLINDLKRLVESWELVESRGGLDEAKKEAEMLEWSNQVEWYNKLIKAIADVESVGGGV